MAVPELRGRESTTDAPKEQISHIAPDLLTAEGEPGVQDKEESIGQGTTTEQPPEVIVKYTSEGDHVGQGARDTVKLGRSSGERWCPGDMRVVFDLFWLQRETWGTSPLGAPPFMQM